MGVARAELARTGGRLCAGVTVVRFGANRVAAIEINGFVTNITLTATFCY